jgi:hypothetical protein
MVDKPLSKPLNKLRVTGCVFLCLYLLSMSNQKMIKPEWIPAAYKDNDEPADKPLQKLVVKPAALLYKSILISKATLGLKSKKRTH